MSLYFSHILLDPTDPRTARVLDSIYLLHQGVMAGFHPQERGEERVLFRVETRRSGREPALLVQSTVAPDWGRCLERFFPGAEVQVKQRSLQLCRGSRYCFRLRANPTVKKAVEGKKNGRRVGIHGEDELRTWLAGKLQSAGARLVSVQVIDEGLVAGQQPAGGPASNQGEQSRGRQVQFHSVLFDGVLEAVDATRLEEALTHGIGSAKGFGFGLLSLALA